MGYFIAFLAWLVLMWPLVTIIRDFGAREGWFFARLYPHFFVFPILAGGFVLFFLVRPVSVSLQYLLQSSDNSLAPVAIYFGVIAVLTLVASVLEAFNRGAIWELSKETLDRDQAEQGSSSLRNITRCVIESATLDPQVDKSSYVQRISEFLKRGGSAARSETFWSYRIAFVPFAAMFLTIYATIILFAVRGVEIEAMNAQAQSVALEHLTISALLLFVWPVMRAYFDYEIKRILPSPEEFNTRSQDEKQAFGLANALILVAFAFGYVLLFIAYFPEQRQTIIAVVGTAVEIGMIILTLLKPKIIYGVGRWIWGVRASIISYGMFLMLLAVIIAYNLFSIFMP